CAVIGSRNALPKGNLIMKPTKVLVRRGDPIYYWDYYDKEVSYPEIRKLTNELQQVIIDLYEGNDEESEKLSIGYPKDMEDKPKSSGLKKIFKNIQHNILQGIDDFWYALLKSLELIGARDAFTKPIYGLTGIILTNYTNLCNPIKVIDFDKNIPKEGGALIACGHNSEWDVLMLPLAIWQNGSRQLYQMSKESLFKIPVVNAWVRTHRAFPLRRGEHDISSYNIAKDALEAGELVVIYPEGTTNPGGGVLLEGHTGAVRIAIEAKAPIIPVGITGTENIYPKHAKMLNFGKGCIIKAGEPFMDHQQYWDKTMPNYDELKRLTERMMDRIRDLMFYNHQNA
ncbi:MAG: lysophospholipid acyltransferase family protein, partial [Promethearchaeota archaeon]